MYLNRRVLQSRRHKLTLVSVGVTVLFNETFEKRKEKVPILYIKKKKKRGKWSSMYLNRRAVYYRLLVGCLLACLHSRAVSDFAVLV